MDLASDGQLYNHQLDNQLQQKTVESSVVTVLSSSVTFNTDHMHSAVISIPVNTRKNVTKEEFEGRTCLGGGHWARSWWICVNDSASTEREKAPQSPMSNKCSGPGAIAE